MVNIQINKQIEEKLVIKTHTNNYYILNSTLVILD